MASSAALVPGVQQTVELVAEQFQIACFGIAFRSESILGIVIWDVPRAASLSLVYGLFQTVSRHYKSGSAEREPRRTHAYDLAQVSQILKVLRLLAKSLVATAAFAGLRRGELRGLEWGDYSGTTLTINRSIWRSVINLPKTRASRDAVPVIPRLAALLQEYRASIGNPQTGVIFHSGDGLRINLDTFTRTVIQPRLETIRIPWFGWHAFGADSRRSYTRWVLRTFWCRVSCVNLKRI